MSDPFCDRARELLRQHLSKDANPAVRLLNELIELPDDDPSVVRIANMLRSTDKRGGGE
jgi:hypothetical protein